MTNEIIKGAEDALGFLRGDSSKGRAHKVRTKEIDVKAIRTRLHMTQAVFSETFAIPVSTLKSGRRKTGSPRDRQKRI